MTEQVSLPDCKALGAPQNHKPEVCFVNPKSHLYQPETWAPRLAVTVQKGLAIPLEIVDQVLGEQLPTGAIVTPAIMLA